MNEAVLKGKIKLWLLFFITGLARRGDPCGHPVLRSPIVLSPKFVIAARCPVLTLVLVSFGIRATANSTSLN